MKRGLLPMILCLALATTPALAGDECGVPVEHWQSRDAALRHATSLGWQVRSLKIDDGCYEIRGHDAQGRAFKAKLDPQTLRVVKMKLRDDSHEPERERRRERDRTPSRDAAPAQDTAAPLTAPAQNPVLTPGTTPRSQIE